MFPYTVQSLHAHLDGHGSLRPGDPIHITVHFPEGDVTVKGWVAETHYENRFQGEHEYRTTLSFYVPRTRHSTSDPDEDLPF